MPLPSRKLFPTGQRTFQFDLSDHIAKQVGAITISSAAWTLPADLTEEASSTTAATVTVTISTSGLTEDATYEGICAVTFSDGQIHQFSVPFVIAYLGVSVA